MHLKTILYVCFPLLLLSCSGDKGKLRLSGKYSGLDQADFLVYSPDGAFVDIDTLHLNKGKFDKTLDVTEGQHTFTIIYPNFQTLSFLATDRKHIEITGDAQALTQVKVEGCDSLLPSRTRPPKQFLKVGKFLPKTPLTPLIKAHRQKKWVLIGLWANWKGSASSVTFPMRNNLEANPDSLAGILCSMDVEPEMRKMGEGQAEQPWESYCDYLGVQSPVMLQLGIWEIPYFLLIDRNGHLAAHGSDFQKNIEPKLPWKKH
ncbi:MAG: DUF4369 domain-containing protein [Bacteroidaceae bacterium]|nr:DUF4369 domain-containing protein [Bacteroidaceae bacterium]